ncbi:hypothetical protein IEQ34_018127 [Dendrobium chrysotoxum]|uniref:Uncharacterized protein n=1 Tax=Dendrobium chrysotoxum TaxID=161865 RepID=A0AAV7GDN0_DENCH|nr:hypothetical protein IEQ34_018127 [Dendrobium chrysotoxum]
MNLPSSLNSTSAIPGAIAARAQAFVVGTHDGERVDDGLDDEDDLTTDDSGEQCEEGGEVERLADNGRWGPQRSKGSCRYLD